jgi:hypothetical protein
MGQPLVQGFGVGELRAEGAQARKTIATKHACCSRMCRAGAAEARIAHVVSSWSEQAAPRTGGEQHKRSAPAAVPMSAIGVVSIRRAEGRSRLTGLGFASRDRCFHLMVPRLGWRRLRNEPGGERLICQPQEIDDVR